MAGQSTIPPHHAMLWPILESIKSLGDSGSNQEIEDRAIDIMGFSDEQQGVLHSGGPRTEIRYRMAWARTYLKIFGAIENSGRGIWSITEFGKTLTKRDTKGIPARVRELNQKKRSESGESSSPVIDQPLKESAFDGEIVDRMETELEFPSDAIDQWQDHLLTTLQSMPPSGFERLCQRILRESGFTNVEVTGKSGDGGIDGIGVLRISLLSFHVFFQCKRLRGSVGAASIRDFRGAMIGRTDKGLFITTGSFTPDAKREATRDGAPVLDLVDGEALCNILKDLGLGISTRQAELLKIDKDWINSI